MVTCVSPGPDGAFMTSEVIDGPRSRIPTTSATFAMRTESYSLVLGKEWYFLSRLVTQVIRLGRLSSTIRLSTIFPNLAFLNSCEHLGQLSHCCKSRPDPHD